MLVVLSQTLKAPDDCVDVSFLLETNHLEEQESISHIKRQREQLKNEQQKLIELADEIAKQVPTAVVFVQ